MAEMEEMAVRCHRLEERHQDQAEKDRRRRGNGHVRFSSLRATSPPPRRGSARRGQAPLHSMNRHAQPVVPERDW